MLRFFSTFRGVKNENEFSLVVCLVFFLVCVCVSFRFVSFLGCVRLFYELVLKQRYIYVFQPILCYFIPLPNNNMIKSDA